MRIGLASYEFRNSDIEFNFCQIEKAMYSIQRSADLLCFGESFLQGFDALTWNYDSDKDIAISQNSQLMNRLCALTVRCGVDLLFGYFEKDDRNIYSSCAVIEKGEIIYNYRRISKGWKIPAADEHYKEGIDTAGFSYRNQLFKIALCGDLWDYPEKFKTDDALIWPIYINFSKDEWEKNEDDYAKHAYTIAKKTFLINSISDNPRSYGGAFYLFEGKIKNRIPYEKEGVLIIDWNE